MDHNIARELARIREENDAMFRPIWRIALVLGIVIILVLVFGPGK